MSSEFTTFRKLLRNWLKTDIAAVVSAVGTKIYPAWPVNQPKFPCIAFALRNRQSAMDIGSPAWQFDTMLYLFGPDMDVLEDSLHDPIMEYLNNNSDAMLAKLSEAGKVSAKSFLFEATDEDPQEAFVEEGQIVLALAMRLKTVIVKPVSGW